MKVLVLMTQITQLGGAERLSVEFAEALNARGTGADVLYLYGEDSEAGRAAEADLRRRGIGRVAGFGLPLHPGPLTALRAAGRVRSFLRDGGYDVLETGMFATSLLGAMATVGGTAVHLCGVHDEYSRETHRGLKYLVWRWTLRLSGSTVFYAISDYVRHRWIAFTGIGPQRIRTVYNSISLPAEGGEPERRAVRAELGVPADGRIALFVGRLLKRKGVDTLVEALGPVLRDRRLHLALVGSDQQGPEGRYPDEAGLLERIRAMIVERGWESHVHFLGWRRDVSRLMAASDVLVHPARIEGFGLVLAEAMAVGCPVVATHVGGIPEVLAGTDSVMVPPGEPAALREATLRVLDRPWAEVQTAREQGRRRAGTFTAARRMEALTRWCAEWLTRRRPGRTVAAPAEEPSRAPGGDEGLR